jgi:hypothetical protein
MPKGRRRPRVECWENSGNRKLQDTHSSARSTHEQQSRARSASGSLPHPRARSWRLSRAPPSSHSDRRCRPKGAAALAGQPTESRLGSTTARFLGRPRAAGADAEPDSIVQPLADTIERRGSGELRDGGRLRCRDLGLGRLVPGEQCESMRSPLCGVRPPTNPLDPSAARWCAAALSSTPALKVSLLR